MKVAPLLFFFITAALIASGMTKVGSTQDPGGGREWKRANASGIDFWIPHNVRVISGPWHLRRVIVFVDRQSFTLENLSTIFAHLSERDPLEDFLEIRACSNDEQVSAESRWFSKIRSLSFGNVPPQFTDGSGVNPSPLSARYSRADGAEYLNYYPAAGESIAVDLKKSSSGCAPTGDTAADLVDASIRGCEDVVEELLDAGADPNVKSRHGGAALVQAAFWGHPEIVELLIDRGADINQTSASGWTPLIAAISGHRDRVIDLLLTRSPDVNVRGEDGRTALTHAVMKRNETVVRELLARGADANVRDGYAKTPLAIAEEEQNKSMIRLLRRGVVLIKRAQSFRR